MKTQIKNILLFWIVSIVPILVKGNSLQSYSVDPIEVVVSEDAYVYDGASAKNTNYGSEERLIIKGDASGYRREVYLKFDLTSVNFTSYNDVQLKLNVKRANDDVPKIQWIVSPSSNEWTEAAITWNNKPVAVGEIAVANGVTAGNDVLFDISKYVLEEIEKGNKVISLHISSTSVAGGKFDADFHSKEATDETTHPRLVISYEEKDDEEEEQDIFDLIMSRIQQKEKNISITSTDNQTKGYLESVNADGSFSDINYASTAQTNWPPISHLNRMKPVVLSYTTEGSQYYEDESVYNKIVSMFQYWYDRHPTSTNWYNPQIGEPQRLGVMLILMRSGKQQLPTELENKIIARIIAEGGAPDQSGSQGTGANKVDIATHWVYRGCLTKSKTVLEKGIQQVFYPLFHTTGEGFQHDYSYLQHGQQLYIGGYGDVIAQGICNVAQYVRGTDYELSQEKFDILFNFMRKTYLPVIRGQYFLYNVAGRSLSRPNAMSKSGFHSVLELLKSVDPDNTDEYDAAIERVKGNQPSSYGLQPLHTHYWRSDYTLHQRPGFTFDVRTVSTRTLRNENGNGENIKGYFLSEGATDIAVDGDEYYNIFPVWDWGRIPGTTTPALTTIPQPGQWGTSGTSTFAGGVSDGVYGVSAFAMRNYEYSSVNTEAKKSWFFFDDEVVCLGAGIRSGSMTQVNTTINQCLLEGDVTVIKNDNSSEIYTTAQKDSRTFNNTLSWILHGKVGYYLPSGGRLVVNNQTQTGSWQSINTSQAGTSVSKDVFKLWFMHGIAPGDDNYAYVVVPNVNTVEKVNEYKKDNVRILSNTALIQAVEHIDLGIVGVVFYGPATFTYDEHTTIRATKPCTVMLRGLKENEVKVHIADPSASLTSLSLIADVPGIVGVKELTCEFPTEKAYAGSTKEFIINSDTPDYTEVQDPNTYILVKEDTYAYGGNKTGNFGSEEMLVVKTDSEAYSRETYLKFDISGINFSKVKDIQLLLTVAEGDTDYLNNTMHITASGSEWSENTLIWNNKPNVTGSRIASVKAVIIGNTLSFDIKDYVLQEVEKGNTILSFKLNNTYTGNVAKTRISFHSKESFYEDMRPRIAITPTEVSIPEINTSDNTIRVYPNPVKKGDRIQINKGNDSIAQVIISDLFGKTIMKTNENSIHTQGLESGLYVLTVVEEENGLQKNVKLIVK
ncbi:MAG: DNRLRE domain-containing protein [Bacteroidales bacterium]|nr:DNRLRE domain-containing protein [Bacteroidales bacterium]